ncbi:MAG: ferredoxin family protein [Anaerolineales bacterium]
MPPVKGWIVVDELHCKGCGLCVSVCPQDVMHLDPARLTAKGYHPAALKSEGCTGCGVCAVVCPDAALSVYRQMSATRQRSLAATA